MQEVELRDYLKVILKRKTIIIFTVMVFFIAGLIMNAYLIKTDFKATAKLMLSNYRLEEKERVLKVYAIYDFALGIKKELKLDSLPPMPELEIIEGDILELSLIGHDPKEAVRICNAFLSKFENEERQKYEKAKRYFQEEIKSAEEKIVELQNQEIEEGIEMSNEEIKEIRKEVRVIEKKKNKVEKIPIYEGDDYFTLLEIRKEYDERLFKKGVIASAIINTISMIATSGAMTITQKILAAHAEKKMVQPGEYILAKVDIALGNDITAPIAIREFYQAGGKQVFDPTKVVLVPDHFAPNKDIQSAEQCKILRDFAREQNLKHYFEIGRMGVEHALLPEKGIVLPGDLVIGADSHTCTYGALGAFATGVGSTDLAAAMLSGEAWFKVPESMKFIYYGKLMPYVSGKDLILHTIGDIGVDGALYRTMEFTGETIDQLSMDSRFTMANMAIEAGAKNGVFAVDATTINYVTSRDAKRGYTIYKGDEDAEYCQVIEYDVSKIEPQVAFPHLPENSKPVSEATGIKIDQVIIGSCTNGRIEDLRVAAEVIKGKIVSRHVRMIVIPATQHIYQQAIKEGLEIGRASCRERV